MHKLFLGPAMVLVASATAAQNADSVDPDAYPTTHVVIELRGVDIKIESAQIALAIDPERAALLAEIFGGIVTPTGDDAAAAPAE